MTDVNPQLIEGWYFNIDTNDYQLDYGYDVFDSDSDISYYADVRLEDLTDTFAKLLEEHGSIKLSDYFTVEIHPVRYFRGPCEMATVFINNDPIDHIDYDKDKAKAWLDAVKDLDIYDVVEDESVHWEDDGGCFYVVSN